MGTLPKERDSGWLMTEPSCFTQWFALHDMFGTVPRNCSEEDDPKKKSHPQTVESCGDTLSKKQVPQQHSLQHPQNHHGWNLRSSPQQQKKWTHLQHHHCFGYSLWKFLGGSVVSNPFIQTSKNLGKGSHNSLNLNSGPFGERFP